MNIILVSMWLVSASAIIGGIAILLCRKRISSLSITMSDQEYNWEEVINDVQGVLHNYVDLDNDHLAAVVYQESVTFLHKLHRISISFVLLLAAVILLVYGWASCLSYICGALISIACGYLAVKLGTVGNIGVLQTATSVDSPMMISLACGCVHGLVVVLAVLVSFTILMLSFGNIAALIEHHVLSAFGMGASTVCLLVHVIAGVYSKAAALDSTAFAETNASQRNTALMVRLSGNVLCEAVAPTIDAFASLSGSMTAAVVLGHEHHGNYGAALPLLCVASSIVSVILGFLAMSLFPNGLRGIAVKKSRIIGLVVLGRWTSTLLSSMLMAAVVWVLDLPGSTYSCLLIGQAAGLIISGWIHFVSNANCPPTRGIIMLSWFGAPNVLIEGLSVGFLSAFLPTVTIAITIQFTLHISGSFYGTALAALGHMSSCSFILAISLCSSIYSNANGIATMKQMSSDVRRVTMKLHAVGIVESSCGRNYKLTAAVLTAASLSFVFALTEKLAISSERDLSHLLAGIIIGSTVPFLFASAILNAECTSAAKAIYKSIAPNVPLQLEDGVTHQRPAFTFHLSRAAMGSCLQPVLIVLTVPFVVGIGLGPLTLYGLLLGALAAGLQLACTLNTSSAAWFSAESYRKEKELIRRESAHERDDASSATLREDPLQDASGPAINVLLKLLAYITVTLSRLFSITSHMRWISAAIIALLVIYIYLWVKSPHQAMVDMMCNSQTCNDSTTQLRTGSCNKDEEGKVPYDEDTEDMVVEATGGNDAEPSHCISSWSQDDNTISIVL